MVIRYVLLLLGLFLIICRANANNASWASDVVQDSFVVERVQSGNTLFTNRQSFRPSKIYLPISVKPIDHPLGREARDLLVSLVEGRRVEAKCAVIYGDGDVCSVSVNGEAAHVALLRAGLAKLMPNINYAEASLRAQEEAKVNRRGVWALDQEAPRQSNPVAMESRENKKVAARTSASSKKTGASAAEKPEPKRKQACRSGNFFADLFGRCEDIIAERERQEAQERQGQSISKENLSEQPRKSLVGKAIDKGADVVGEKIAEKAQEEITKSFLEGLRKKVLGF